MPRHFHQMRCRLPLAPMRQFDASQVAEAEVAVARPVGRDGIVQRFEELGKLAASEQEGGGFVREVLSVEVLGIVLHHDEGFLVSGLLC